MAGGAAVRVCVDADVLHICKGATSRGYTVREGMHIIISCPDMSI